MTVRAEVMVALRRQGRLGGGRQVWWIMVYAGDPPARFAGFLGGFGPEIGGWSVCNFDTTPGRIDPAAPLGSELLERMALKGMIHELGVDFSEGIDSATLRLFGQKRDTIEPSVTVAVYGVTDQGWTEPGLTWDTRPAAGPAAVASKVISAGTHAWHEFDVTEYLRAQQGAGATLVAFALRAPSVSEGWPVFNSDGAGANRPELVADLPPAF